MNIHIDELEHFFIIKTDFTKNEKIQVDSDHIQDEIYNISMYTGKFQFKFRDGAIKECNAGDGYTQDMYEEWTHGKNSRYCDSEFVAVEDATTFCIKPKFKKFYQREYKTLNRNDTESLCIGYLLFLADGSICIEDEVHHAPALIEAANKTVSVAVVSENALIIKFNKG
jgi:hypothetical protein